MDESEIQRERRRGSGAVAGDLSADRFQERAREQSLAVGSRGKLARTWVVAREAIELP